MTSQPLHYRRSELGRSTCNVTFEIYHIGNEKYGFENLKKKTPIIKN